MGPELGEVFHELGRELSWLHIKWQQYVALFGTSEEQVLIMNETAASFFYIVQNALWEDTLLHLARLTDRPATMGKENLTLFRLESLVSREHKDRVALLSQAVREKTMFAIDWRMRQLAHRDLDLALNRSAKPLEPASQLKVREALQAMADLLNEIDRAYRDSETRFEPIPPREGAEALLDVLREGLGAMEQKLKKEREEWE
jgi:hypothetical protein